MSWARHSAAASVTVLLGTASLGYWGFVVGRRAHFTGWRLVGAVMAGLLIGVVIRLIQVFLQPGKVMSGGVALGRLTLLVGAEHQMFIDAT